MSGETWQAGGPFLGVLFAVAVLRPQRVSLEVHHQEGRNQSNLKAENGRTDQLPLNIQDLGSELVPDAPQEFYTFYNACL